MNSTTMDLYLVSACLVGLCTRYDAKIAIHQTCMQRLQNSHWIPVCPEQLGGMPTPREPADIVGGDGHDVLAGKAAVITKSGKDVTSHFIKGAEQILTLARMQSVQGVLLKTRSPSCSVSSPVGVTAALLMQNSIQCDEY